jgi:hypothetical protein
VGIALDDVGADVRSLALMPLLRPDVIKLDLRLVHEQATTEVAEIVNAVNAERERTGALVLARASRPRSTSRPRAPWARPSARAGCSAAPASSSRRRAAAPPAAADRAGPASDDISPYQAVRRHRDVRRGRQGPAHRDLAAARAPGRALGETGADRQRLPERRALHRATRRRYTMLGADAAFVAALGRRHGRRAAPGVRGAALAPTIRSPASGASPCWGPHFAAALVASTSATPDRRWSGASTSR